MSDIITIAGIQMNPKLMDVSGNLKSCIKKIKESADNGANLIVFPECTLTGYMFADIDEAMSSSETVPGPCTEEIVAVCRAKNVFAVIGLLEKIDNAIYNAAVLIGPQGLIAKYRKAHLPYSGIDRFVSQGDIPLSVYSTDIGRIGLGICYDIAFPEHARTLTLHGADIIALPANWPRMTEGYPKYFVSARAMENHVYFVAVNRVGEERDVTFIGRSRIAYWLGVLAKGKDCEEDVLYAQIDPFKAREKRIVAKAGELESDVIGDRRPELYCRSTGDN